MGKWLLAMAWLFILGVTAYDSYFAWHYRAGFDVWELNPLARYAASHAGVGGLFVLKAGIMVFALA
ncbi:MAG: hypothetical protein ACJ8F7_14355, partial [Gemmataceae bacterium]